MVLPRTIPQDSQVVSASNPKLLCAKEPPNLSASMPCDAAAGKTLMPWKGRMLDNIRSRSARSEINPRTASTSNSINWNCEIAIFPLSGLIRVCILSSEEDTRISFWGLGFWRRSLTVRTGLHTQSCNRSTGRCRHNNLSPTRRPRRPRIAARRRIQTSCHPSSVSRGDLARTTHLASAAYTRACPGF